jgi:hypothetical protein
MNPRTFLQEFEESADRERLVDVVYDEMVAYCKENDITSNEVDTPTLERLAEGFVERGFGVPPSYKTLSAKGKYQSEEFVQAMEEFQEIDPKIIRELKRLSKENEDYSWTEELGSASDGSEVEQ